MLDSSENINLLHTQADKWGARWCCDGTTLQFGNANAGVAFKLSPQATALLAAQLGQWLIGYESVHGTLWSEDHEARGSKTLERLQWICTGAKDSADARMLRLVQNLPLTGFERSVKLLTGQLRSNRFLVGLPCSAISPHDVQNIAMRLGLPTHYLPTLLDHLKRANFVHFGFEQGRSAVYKIYLEFPQAMAELGPLYLGWKWDTDHQQRHSTSSYTQCEMASVVAIVNTVREVFPTEVSPALVSAVQNLMQFAAHDVAQEAIRLVQVRDDNNPRFSMDVNFYTAQLRIADLAPALAPVLAQLGVSPAQQADLLMHTKEDVLGHISAGMDAQGAPFVTLYHGRASRIRTFGKTGNIVE